MRRRFVLVLLALGAGVLLSACALGNSVRQWGSQWLGSSGEPAAVGKRIYFSAMGADGPIRYQGGPVGGGMMSGRLACAACHGPDGRGGRHVMHMQTMDAPDIRWSVLSSGAHGEHGAGEGEAMAYDFQAFKMAVTMGVSPEGRGLSGDMPRWQMSDADLEALIEFLKTLP